MNSLIKKSLCLLTLPTVLLLGACGDSQSPEENHEGHSDEDTHGDLHEEQGSSHEGEELVHLSREACEGFQEFRIEKQEVSDSIRFTAEVGWNEDRLAHVTPRITGRVVEVPASLGKLVQQGEVLAVLDSIELGESKSVFLAAKSRYSLAKRNYEREKGLYEKRISSEREYLEAQNVLEEARITLTTSRQRLILLGISKQDVAKLTHTEGLSLFPIRAPFKGSLVEKHVTPGEMVDTGEEILTVVDTTKVWVWLNVYEKNLSQIQPGNQVELEFRAYPGEAFQGEIKFLGAIL